MEYRQLIMSNIGILRLADKFVNDNSCTLFMVYWETSIFCCSIITHAWALVTIWQQTGDTSQYTVNNT